MSLIKYNNRQMPSGIFNLLEDVFSDEFNTSRRSIRKESVPSVNIKESDKSFELEIAVPGMAKKDINVSFEENVLTISSENTEDKKEEKDNYTRREFRYASFKRSFNIPEEADASKIEAKHENGVLSINIPKKEVKASLKKMIKVA